MASIPITWNEIIPLAGQVGKFIVIVRRKENKWYVGAMSNEEPHEVPASLDILNGKTYSAELMKYGVNAGRYAEDYIIEKHSFSKVDPITLKLARSGGHALKLIPR